MEKRIEDLDPEQSREVEKDIEKEEPTKDEKLENDQPPKYFHSSGSSDIYASSPVHSSGKKIPFLLGIAIIILVLTGSFFLFRGSGEETKSSPTPSPLSETELTPSPSPEVSFDRSKYTLRILNGTKTQGLAASASSKLKDLGYKIEKTGNATNSAFLKTIVRVKPDLSELLENLIKDLRPDFEVEEGVVLDNKDNVDSEIILGQF